LQSQTVHVQVAFQGQLHRLTVARLFRRIEHDNVEALRDFDYNDVVVSCTSLDPTVNPPATDPPLDFTITEDQLRPADPRGQPR
jgi:hypothetical protein